jgi:RNA polymerase sigma-70 factor (ECF subfamily)
MTEARNHSSFRRPSEAGGAARITFDQQYVQNLAAGHPATQQHFVGYFTPMLWMKIRARRRSCECADDIIQDTFVRVSAALRRDSVRNPECLGAFVNSVCNNVLLEYYRRNRRFVPFDDKVEPVDQRAAGDAIFEADEKKELLRRVLDRLSARDRDLLRRLFLEEHDPDSICKQYRVTREYLRVLVHRALKSARQHAAAMTSR